MLTTYARVMDQYRSSWHATPGSVATFKPCASPFCAVCRMVGESMHDFGRAMMSGSDGTGEHCMDCGRVIRVFEGRTKGHDAGGPLYWHRPTCPGVRY